MDGLTRRQALTATAAAAGAAALARTGPAAARGRHGGDDRGGGHGPKRVAPPLTLTGANLLDPDSGRVTERATIVFENGVVRRAGRGERPASGGRVIDVGGAFVLPGLIDAHVHAATVAAAQLALQRGATTVRSASTAFFQDVGLRGDGRGRRARRAARAARRACSSRPTSATASSPTRRWRRWRCCRTACAAPRTWPSSRA